MNHHGNIPFFAVVDYKFCPAGCSIPKGQDKIRVFNDGYIPFEWGRFSIFSIFRQVFGQFQTMMLGIFPRGGIHPACAAGYDFGCIFGKILTKFATCNSLEPITATFIMFPPVSVSNIV